MTHIRDESPLSHIELVVLARLSKSKPSREEELRKAVLELCLPDATAERARAEAADVVTALRRRGLVSKERNTRTEDGARALRTALGLARAPNWKQVPAIFTALSRGLPPGSKAADEPSLSRIEIVVLARLSESKPPSEEELGKVVLELCLPDASPESARLEAGEVVTALRRRGLVSTQRRTRTQNGARALRRALGLARAPSWEQIPSLLAALALGFPPDSEAAKVVCTEDALAAAVLCEKLAIPEAPTSSSMCDALIAEALGMRPGTMTLSRIRTHVLARRAGIDAASIDAKGEPMELAARLAAAAVGARPAERLPIAKALGRRWVRGESDPTSTRLADTSRSAPTLHVPNRDDERLGDTTRASQLGERVAPHLDDRAQQIPPPVETLLEVVRETIPRVGADGRFGSEKVFVSAIWRSIEHDRRLIDLSLDRFKRWLVTANRDGWLVLARADLIGAMDSKQVAESEIEDRGATFHFVLDQRTGTSAFHRGSHAR